ncbi:uncharacterized protein LOC133872402 isoform X2 [Alnus glutinosa]|nr:uncharacterized protein LOC133872402 isoform X2 [Alnus glutinosa]
MERFSNCRFQVGSRKLQSLSLAHVRVLDDLFLERVLSPCNSLNKLCLDGVSGTNNITIRSSSLKYLEFRSYRHNYLLHLNVFGELLEELKIYWTFFPPGGRSLKIATPNLKCFTWDGFAPDNCFLGNLKCLRSCTLNLEQLSSSWRPPSLEYFKFLEGINDLEIQFRCLKELYKVGMVPITLMHVHTLRISLIPSDGKDDNAVRAISLLLMGGVNVEAWSMTNGKSWLIYKACSREERMRQLQELMKPIVKFVPEKR